MPLNNRRIWRVVYISGIRPARYHYTTINMMMGAISVNWTVQQDKVCIRPGFSCLAFFIAVGDEYFIYRSLVLSFSLM